MSKFITGLTRRDLFDIIIGGIDSPIDIGGIGPQYLNKTNSGELKVRMSFCGRLDEIEFLSRLYNLKDMPSYDSRFDNAEGDIYQHTVNNYDWDAFWFFEDDRFELGDGSDDEPILSFICEMIHPEVVIRGSPWKLYLEKFNEILSPDGYELYPNDKISGRDVYYFKRIDAVGVKRMDCISYYQTRFIGEGSYAQVLEYEDSYYNRKFAIKRAKNNLDVRELLRFKREFEVMQSLNSIHVLEVFSYDESKNEYVMEHMDMTLKQYICKNNSCISSDQRKSIIEQLTKGYQYLHSKGHFHRDVSANNVLIRQFDDDTILVKISDFGLVKIPDSNLTRENTEVKGTLIDPNLMKCGFGQYSLSHEIYALTGLFVFVMTGKTNYEKISDPNIRTFIDKGMNPHEDERYQSLNELKEAAIWCLS